LKEKVMDDNGVLREIISRKEAKEEGLDYYFTGKPCKNNHILLRRVVGKKCVRCIKEYQKRFRDDNKHYFQEYRKENNEHIREYAKEYRRRNRDYINSYQRDYYSKNRSQIKEYKNNWRKEKYKEDSEYKVSIVCRNLLRRVIEGGVYKKQDTSQKSLGYSSWDLFNNIGNKLLHGMSWDNYGEWQIDHNYPVSRYLQDGVHDPAIINSLDNLFPMWAEDNHLKFNRTLEEFLEDFPDQAEKYKHFLEENYYE